MKKKINNIVKYIKKGVIFLTSAMSMLIASSSTVFASDFQINTDLSFMGFLGNTWHLITVGLAFVGVLIILWGLANTFGGYLEGGSPDFKNGLAKLVVGVVFITASSILSFIGVFN